MPGLEFKQNASESLVGLMPSKKKKARGKRRRLLISQCCHFAVVLVRFGANRVTSGALASNDIIYLRQFGTGREASANVPRSETNFQLDHCA